LVVSRSLFVAQTETGQAPSLRWYVISLTSNQQIRANGRECSHGRYYSEG
jgi:hypothetical protein